MHGMSPEAAANPGVDKIAFGAMGPMGPWLMNHLRGTQGGQATPTPAAAAPNGGPVNWVPQPGEQKQWKTNPPPAVPENLMQMLMSQGFPIEPAAARNLKMFLAGRGAQ